MDYKDFDINTSTTPKPWGAREEQVVKDIIDTLVNDSLAGAKSTGGHKHTKVYNGYGSPILEVSGNDMSMGQISSASTFIFSIGSDSANALNIMDSEESRLHIDNSNKQIKLRPRDASVPLILNENSDVYSKPWTDYSDTSSITGWGSFDVDGKFIYYKTIGNLAFIKVHLKGTSNSQYTNFTLPFNILIIGGSGIQSIGHASAYDNGTIIPNNYADMLVSGTTIHVCLAPLGASGYGGWTASGQKIVSAAFVAILETAEF